MTLFQTEKSGSVMGDCPNISTPSKRFQQQLVEHISSNKCYYRSQNFTTVNFVPSLAKNTCVLVTQLASKFESELVIVHICLPTWCTVYHSLKTFFQLILTISHLRTLLHLNCDRLPSPHHA